MGTIHKNWAPNWWGDQHGNAWDRVKEAIKRDWEQTKRDLKVGGHELNQDVANTVRQAAGREAVPPIDKANPPKVIGNWDDVELPVRYGYGAREQFGTDWNDNVEQNLRSEWERGNTDKQWDTVKTHVRHGYEYRR